MRHDSGEPQPRTRLHAGQDLEGIMLLASPASHPRIELEMQREHDPESGRLEFEISDLIDRMGREMKFLVGQQVHRRPASVELMDRHEHENVGPASRGGHREGLLGAVGRERPNTHLSHRSGDSRGSEAVGVGFDDGTDPLPVRNSTSGQPGDRLEVPLEGIQIDPN